MLPSRVRIKWLKIDFVICTSIVAGIRVVRIPAQTHICHIPKIYEHTHKILLTGRRTGEHNTLENEKTKETNGRGRGPFASNAFFAPACVSESLPVSTDQIY